MVGRQLKRLCDQLRQVFERSQLALHHAVAHLLMASKKKAAEEAAPNQLGFEAIKQYKGPRQIWYEFSGVPKVI